MALDIRQANDIAAFYRATGQLPPGVSLSDPAITEAMARLGGRATNLNPAGGLDQNIIHDFLSGFGQSTTRIDPVNDIIIPAATAASFEIAPIPTIAGLAGSAAGTAAGHDLGGDQGAQIGGITGGIVGGAAGGIAAGGAAGAGTSAADSVAAGTSQETFAGGAAFNPTATATGAVGGATDSVFNPSTGISGTGAGPALGGGSGPGASLGTDPSTSQTLGGGATGGAATPGSSALGTGAQPSVTPQGNNALSIVNDIGSAAKLASSLDALANPPSPQAQQGQQTTAGTTAEVTPPIGAAPPVSQIAAQPTPAVQPNPAEQTQPTPAPLASGQFDNVTQDFVRQAENQIRAQFGNQNISGSPMEHLAIQRADQAAQARASDVERAMSSTGVSDPSVFKALMASNLQSNQFAQALQQLRARNAV